MMILLTVLIICAVVVSFIKSLTASVIVFGSFSLVVAVIWMLLESPDLAITEAAVGAGVTGLLFYATLKKIGSIKDANKKEKKVLYRVFRITAGLLIVMLAAALIFCMFDLPGLFSPDHPGENVVAERYIESGIEETGAVNFVAGMILDYRAFDTFGESNVLFAATICVMVLLLVQNRGKKEDLPESKEYYEDLKDEKEIEPKIIKNDVILKTVAKVAVPFILMFGLYVILNGHLSPGGGFSGGAIVGSGFILASVAFGFDRMERFLNKKSAGIITFVSLLVYCLAKSYSFFTGANHLESGIPLGTPGDIMSSGLILILNICVGFVVACTMYSFFSLMRRGKI
jgi:multicomponent Na+:H+ antiporter subunit B